MVLSVRSLRLFERTYSPDANPQTYNVKLTGYATVALLNAAVAAILATDDTATWIDIQA